MRSVAFPLSLLLAGCLFAQDELPVDPDQPLEIEPPLLIQQAPDGKQTSATQEAVTEPDFDRIAVALEAARKSAAAGDRLYQRGIIAKLDAERRVLKVVRLESDLANAKLDGAKQAAVTAQAQFDAKQISQSELEAAQSASVAATSDAAAATARWEKAQLDAALLNLTRQKKLFALGSGRKSEVTRAEEKVTELQQKKN